MQPIWQFLANLGDASPIEHGGLFIYRDSTGVYPEEIELLREPECDVDDPSARWTVYRTPIDRCKVVRKDGKAYLVSAKYDPSWPYPVHMYQEWFAKDLASVAETMGTTRPELIRSLCCDDPTARAFAYRDIADHHGWENFDAYPLTLTRAEVEARYTLGEI